MRRGDCFAYRIWAMFCFDSDGTRATSTKMRHANSHNAIFYAFLARRPLYGSRHAPRRWGVKLATIMRGAGYMQMRSDIRTYVKHAVAKDKSDRVIPTSEKDFLAMAAAHVGDLIFLGNRTEYESYVRAINHLRRGDAAMLDFRQSFVLCGLQISLIPPRCVRVNQNDYASQGKALVRSVLIDNVKISERNSWAIFNQFGGAIFRLVQTRCDMSSPFRNSIQGRLAICQMLMFRINLLRPGGGFAENLWSSQMEARIALCFKNEIMDTRRCRADLPMLRLLLQTTRLVLEAVSPRLDVRYIVTVP